MRTIFIAFTLLLANLSIAGEQFSSGTEQVAVIELFTSEGCSSCPPADRWLSKLKQDDRLFKQVIPLAFHVDYWDYLGWRDEFADEKFSQRQRQYHHLGHTQSVYTPGFVINGNEWRGFFSPLHRNLPPIDGNKAQVGELSLTGEGETFTVRYAPSDHVAENLIINFVYLGTGLNNRIKRGENAGRMLEHDFVVLAMTRKNLKHQGETLEALLPRAQIKHATAVAAWVSTRDDPAPIQAVGGWLAVH